LGPLRILTKISENIRNFVFIADGDKMFTGIDDTGNKLSPVSLLLAITLTIGVNDTG
jgi:hypothetical protein